VLLPISGVAAAAAAVTLGAVLHWWPTSAIGPLLIAVSLAALVLMPRLAIHAAHLPLDQAVDDTLHQRAALAHELLTRLIITTAGTASAGVVFIVATGTPGIASESLLAASAAVLLLHRRAHSDSWCIAALLIAGGIAVTALVGLLVIEHLRWAPWIIGGFAIVTSTPLWLTAKTPLGPTSVRRNVAEIVEFAAAATVVPLACWAAGWFSAVRGLSFP